MSPHRVDLGGCATPTELGKGSACASCGDTTSRTLVQLPWEIWRRVVQFVAEHESLASPNEILCVGGQTVVLSDSPPFPSKGSLCVPHPHAATAHGRMHLSIQITRASHLTLCSPHHATMSIDLSPSLSTLDHNHSLHFLRKASIEVPWRHLLGTCQGFLELAPHLPFLHTLDISTNSDHEDTLDPWIAYMDDYAWKTVVALGSCDLFKRSIKAQLRLRSSWMTVAIQIPTMDVVLDVATPNDPRLSLISQLLLHLAPCPLRWIGIAVHVRRMPHGKRAPHRFRSSGLLITELYCVEEILDGPAYTTKEHGVAVKVLETCCDGRRGRIARTHLFCTSCRGVIVSSL